MKFCVAFMHPRLSVVSSFSGCFKLQFPIILVDDTQTPFIFFFFFVFGKLMPVEGSQQSPVSLLHEILANSSFGAFLKLRKLDVARKKKVTYLTNKLFLQTSSLAKCHSSKIASNEVVICHIEVSFDLLVLKGSSEHELHDV